MLPFACRRDRDEFFVPLRRDEAARPFALENLTLPFVVPAGKIYSAATLGMITGRHVTLERDANLSTFAALQIELKQVRRIAMRRAE